MDIKFAPLDLVIIVAFAMFSIAFLAWFVALLYNGFKTATNLKLTQHNVAFGFMIITAEALSKLLMYLINY
jgi:hypothetical protein